MPNRKELIQRIEEARGSRLICYVTGDRKGQEVQIGDDALPILAQHLSYIGRVDKFDLLIYSRGGNTLTGFALANALREFGDSIHILVPFRAHSCATLISLGANTIVAGPFAQLSPIDPTITTPHSPTIEQQGQIQFLPVSVEDVANYFELAKQEAGLKEEQYLASVLGHLAQRVSPLALGAVYRAREQIGMLASKLLTLHMNDQERIDQIIKKLTRELLSHDYVITRREAKSIGLPIVDASPNESDLMWSIYEDAAQELTLGEPWSWEKEVLATQPRTTTRAVIESRDLKHIFTSTYQIKRVTVSPQGGGKGRTDSLQITPLDEGSWKKV
ncbi:MAG: serine protease [Chloroflexi bacterium]|nr:serine protease [Chloroflexota bacterium]